MSLNKAQLETDIRAIFDATLANTGSAADAKEAFVKDLATAIDTYVKTATIKYISGLTAPNGLVSGTFTGRLE